MYTSTYMPRYNHCVCWTPLSTPPPLCYPPVTWCNPSTEPDLSPQLLSHTVTFYWLCSTLLYCNPFYCILLYQNTISCRDVANSGTVIFPHITVFLIHSVVLYSKPFSVGIHTLFSHLISSGCKNMAACNLVKLGTSAEIVGISKHQTLEGSTCYMGTRTRGDPQNTWTVLEFAMLILI